MSKSWLRFGELVALVVLALALIGLAAFMVSENRMGEAFGSALSSLPLLIQAIRNIGQAAAMAQMADALAQSQPAPRAKSDEEN